MPAVKYQVRGKSNPSKLTVRFIVDKDTDYRLTIPLSINPKYFNNKNGKVRQIAEFEDKINVQQQLDDFQNFVLKEFNNSLSQNTNYNSSWLKEKIDTHFKLVKKTDNSFLINYCDFYLDNLKNKRNDRTDNKGSSKATITKYTTIKKKLESFEKFSRTKYRIQDVDLSFRDKFLDYLIDVEKLGRNTTGRYLGCLKTIVIDAEYNGINVNRDIKQIKGFNVEADKIFLTPEELETIINTPFEDEKLRDARDLLYMGCYLGQRVSDLMRLHHAKIENKGSIGVITITQKKTKKTVGIPILPPVDKVLERRLGKFPKPFSENLNSSSATFNKLIKTVCKDAGLSSEVLGSRINPENNRKEKGMFPKYQLVTSHICRRSFATNFYAKMPTALIIRVTGHSTEREMLNYIAKPPIDFAEEMARYFNKIEF